MDVSALFIKDNPELGLKILSSIADLSIENQFLYKTLTYLFKQYKAY
jgi:hypothetical protein